MVYDDDVMEFVLEIGKDSLYFFGDCVFKFSFFICFVEFVILVIFFGKY